MIGAVMGKASLRHCLGLALALAGGVCVSFFQNIRSNYTLVTLTIHSPSPVNFLLVLSVAPVCGTAQFQIAYMIVSAFLKPNLSLLIFFPCPTVEPRAREGLLEVPF